MPKKSKKTAKTPRVSAKQKLFEYKTLALEYIGRLRNPGIAPGFSVTSYTVTPTGKKANVISVPELGAIVGTARQLGSEVRVRFTGTDDNAKVIFEYVNAPANIPAGLLYTSDEVI